MTSPASSLEKVTPPVRLEYKGAHIPSFKNAWMPVGKRMILDPSVKARKQAIVESFVWQLLSDIQLSSAAMQMGLSRRSLIASLLPADDCWTIIPEIIVSCELVAKGQEGCAVIIHKLV